MAIAKTVKKKKKIWVPVHAPKNFNEALLGETTTDDHKSLIGKTLTLNLSIFTNDMRKQNTETSFKIISVVDDKAQTEFIGLSLTNSHVKRLVRRGKSKIEDSFVVKTKDGKDIRVKPIVITNNVVNKSVSMAIRKQVKEKITELVKKKSGAEFLDLVINQGLQKDLKKELGKIYPLRYADIRVAKLL